MVLQVGAKVRLLSFDSVQNVKVSEIREMGTGRAQWEMKGGSLMNTGNEKQPGPRNPPLMTPEKEPQAPERDSSAVLAHCLP